MKNELTAEQLGALRRFAAYHGRYWKTEVRDLWMRAIARTDDETTVYALRNTHGPSWLNRFRLTGGYQHTWRGLPRTWRGLPGASRLNDDDAGEGGDV